MKEREVDGHGGLQIVGERNGLVLSPELGDALVNTFTQHAQHDGDQATNTGAGNVVEVVAWQILPLAKDFILDRGPGNAICVGARGSVGVDSLLDPSNLSHQGAQDDE